VRKELRNRVLAFNRARAADREAAEDLAKLLTMLPPGAMKQIVQDADGAAILERYGVGEE